MGGLVSRIIDTLFPRNCAECNGRLAPDERVLCIRCNMLLPRLNHFAKPYDNDLAQLFYGKVEIERAAAFLLFRPHSDIADIIYHMKYHQRPDIARNIGYIMGMEALKSGFLGGMDAIIPVPITAKRQLKRGYNQSLMLAEGICDASGIPVLRNVLIRRYFRESQTALSHLQRLENVKDVFFLADADSVRGKHILLVDDVITTGATTSTCARCIHLAGDCTVSVFSFGLAKKS